MRVGLERQHQNVENRKDTPEIWRLWLTLVGTASRYTTESILKWEKTQEFIKNHFPQFKDKDKVTYEDVGHITDLVTGSVALSVVGSHYFRTRSLVKKGYSEAVGIEFDKDSKDVTWNDLAKSQNVIVQRTRSNLFSYNALRVVASSTAFLRPVSRLLGLKLFDKLDSTMLALGVSGSLYAYELVGRPQTFFEAFQAVIGDEYSSKENLIVKGDVNNLYRLYQKYCDDFEPYNVDIKDDKRIAERQFNSNIIFSHISKLFEKSYKDQNLYPIKNDFDLSHFICLLGTQKEVPRAERKGRMDFFGRVMNRLGFRNDPYAKVSLINPDNLEETMLYIELLHLKDFKTVIQARDDISSGKKTVEDVAKEHSINVSRDFLIARHKGEAVTQQQNFVEGKTSHQHNITDRDINSANATEQSSKPKIAGSPNIHNKDVAVTQKYA